MSRENRSMCDVDFFLCRTRRLMSCPHLTQTTELSVSWRSELFIHAEKQRRIEVVLHGVIVWSNQGCAIANTVHVMSGQPEERKAWLDYTAFSTHSRLSMVHSCIHFERLSRSCVVVVL